MRYAMVALLGRSNVGKSTFLNSALREPLAIVSSRLQTTRDALMGVVNLQDAQLVFVDTPGIHKPKNELGRRMNATAIESARLADIVVLMLDASMLARSTVQTLHSEDSSLLDLMDDLAPPRSLLFLNKTDLLRDKSRLLPLLQAVSERRTFDACLPLSAKDSDDVALALRQLTECAPEGPRAYSNDTLTDRPLSFFVREYVREQLLLQTRGEVPHGVAVTLDTIEESRTLLRVSATILVEKLGQKAIVVGRAGQVLKRVGIGARERLEQLAHKQVYLKLYVKVMPRWRNLPKQLQELGYDRPDKTSNR